MFQYISPLFRKNYYFPYFYKFTPTPFFQKCRCSLHTLCVFRFPPNFDHDAFMHHTMHVLDAPGNKEASNKDPMTVPTEEEEEVDLSISKCQSKPAKDMPHIRKNIFKV